MGGKGGGALQVHILRGSSQLLIALTLKPDATMDDLPYVVELARAADRRLSAGVSLPRLETTSPPKGMGGWIPGGNRPPQKGPKPFTGW
jgi:hypothetical protein